MAKQIIIKPLITEKADKLSESLNKYTFLVNKNANKVEIKKAIKDWFNVEAESVNTVIMPSKSKVRNTKTGIQRGRKASYKKAIVTLEAGEEIDFFGEI
ncbi:MAG: large subunit ribosomal protein L23 [Paraglaciecola sp.]|jgi:large subunit ribosomal protein L23